MENRGKVTLSWFPQLSHSPAHKRRICSPKRSTLAAPTPSIARQLQKLPQLDDQARHKLSIIAEEVRHLEEMVAEMRDFVRRPPVHKKPGRIQAAIRTGRGTVPGFFAGASGPGPHRVEQAPLPTVAFDPQQLHEVLINLLKVAVEAMPQGGEITLAGRVRGNFVEVSVSDSGEGIPAG